MPFSEPSKVVAQLGVKPGMIIADLGAGSGRYTLALARAAEGLRVYAIEVQKELLEKLAAEARANNLRNIEVIWGNIEKRGGTKLKDSSVDLGLFSNALFQLPGKYTAALEAKRILKPEGRLAVIDWNDSFGGLGPHPREIVTAPAAAAIFREAGFREERSLETGDHHWGTLFSLAKSETNNHE